jgi:hypothetical protein
VTPGVRPAWGLLITGATGQALVEIAAADPLVFRIPAATLILAVLVVNAVRTRYRRGQAGTAAVLLLAALPLWLSHAVTVLRDYGVSSMVLAAFSPCMLIFGTTFRQLLHTKP